MLIFTAKFKTFRRFNIFSRTKGPDWDRIAELLKIGIPNALSTTMEVLLFAAVSVLMGTLSVQASAAHQVAINIAATVFMIPLGLSLAISQRVGVSMGKGLIQEARFRGFTGYRCLYWRHQYYCSIAFYFSRDHCKCIYSRCRRFLI